MQQIVAVDSQQLNEMQSCWRKFKYYHLEDFRPVVTPDYFEKGDMLHRMLRTYYAIRKHRSHWQSNHKTHADVVDACIKVGRHAAIKMSIDIEEIEETIKAFRAYCEFYVNDGWDQILFTERKACRVMHEDSDLIILYEGQIDLGIRLTNCVLMPVDHKSSKRRGEVEPLSNQFMGYCWLLGVRNIIINKIGFQKTLKSEEKFQRQTLSYTDGRIEDWRNESVWWIRESLRRKEEDYYPHNLTSCDKYSGCIFRDVCKSDPVTREWKLRSLFEQKEKWDVGKDL